MEVLRRYVLVFTSLCMTLFAWGENLQSIEADFEQIAVNEDGVPTRYEGHIIGKMPSKVKWDYKAPLQKEIYMNKNEVIMYEPRLEQVSHSRLKDKADFLSILKSAKKHNDGTYHTKVDGIEYVLFIDKAQKPERIEFVDSMGVKTTLKLKNVKLNGVISDKKFVFVPPQGVEIVELHSR
ncbi:outer membrane lipoprotein chaperone LolA [Helicobacter sp. MIT 03-1614]|uniref:LolA-like outer membrane lipoprotein chaperone n=1 Tax=Helicobacter sp. MIT 03-1614 TaxID=1548147 RepID=UPI000513FA0F|nr:LolA-like outer membrane lipoprotein chaperone [Helicobacter sp. MIT 03-1614]TLD87426.1 outer membrane lipoprotein chaperone LolA [Helicobacter sp. MIT 03-1614]